MLVNKTWLSPVNPHCWLFAIGPVSALDWYVDREELAPAALECVTGVTFLAWPGVLHSVVAWGLLRARMFKPTCMCTVSYRSDLVSGSWWGAQSLERFERSPDVRYWLWILSIQRLDKGIEEGREGLLGWSLGKPGQWLHCLALWWLELPLEKSCCFSHNELMDIFPYCSIMGDLNASLKTLDMVIKLSCYLSGSLYVLLGNSFLGPLACCFSLPSLIKRKIKVRIFVLWSRCPNLCRLWAKDKAGAWRSVFYFFLIVQLWVLARSLWGSQ